MKTQLMAILMMASTTGLVACGTGSLDSAQESRVTNSTIIGQPNTRPAGSDKKYVSRQTRMDCDGLESFDFILESAALIGEWCKEQNNQLGAKGCGVGTSMCVKELLVSDLPGGNLAFGLGVTATTGDWNSSGTSVTQSGFVWSPSLANGKGSDWSSSSSFNVLEITLSVGVDIPLGSRKLRRVTCVNPLDHDYIRLLTDKVLSDNQHLKSLTKVCRVRK